jgi:SAM-dependent methyltransferase
LGDEPKPPPYLAPYLRAARLHGGGFGALLWASPYTQAARFDAIRRLGDLAGRSVLDVGCGRADLLDYLLSRGVVPAEYTGIEAVADLAAAARAKGDDSAPPTRCRRTIVEADFVAEPARLFVGADVVVMSGSLNTAEDETFYATLRTAFAAAGERVVFNFLASPDLAAADYLRWRRPADVVAFARELSADVRTLQDYLPGDCTVAVRKPAR